MASVTKRANGTWQAKVRRYGLPLLPKVFRRRIGAVAWSNGQESEFDRGVWKDRTTADATTLYVLLDACLRKDVPLKRGTDVEVLRIGTIRRDPLSHHKLGALTPMVAAQWRDDRLAAGAAGSTSIANWGFCRRW